MAPTSHDKSEQGEPSAAMAASKQQGLKAELLSNMRYRSLWMEASGAVGDLGTFVPIVVALTLVRGLDLGTSLIFTGVYNIITGLMFGVPMPVQPMKTIAAVALSQDEQLSIPEIMAAGICTSGLLFVLGVTRLMGLVQRIVPLSVVRGIQLSQGLNFAITAVKYVLRDQNFSKNKSLGKRQWLGLDGLLLALICFCFIVIASGSGDNLIMRAAEDRADEEEEKPRRPSGFRRRLEWVPTAMVVFVLGIVLTFIRRPGIASKLKVGPATPQVMHITKEQWKRGFVKAAVPQIPLSVLNSVIAVCKLSNDLYPDKIRQVTATKVSTSVGMMNLVGCWFGALPVCHGAGGLAGQWRFGARSGLAVVMLGTVKLILGFVLGNSLVKILAGYPVGILGVLLLYAGLELAMTVRDMTRRGDSFVVLIAAAVSISAADATKGFVVSLIVHMMLTLPDMTPSDIRRFLVSNFLPSRWRETAPSAVRPQFVTREPV